MNPFVRTLLASCLVVLAVLAGCLAEPTRRYDDQLPSLDGSFEASLDAGSDVAILDASADVPEKPDGVVDAEVIETGPTDFTVGGTVTGLFGAGLVLQNNGGNDLAVLSPGAFAFSVKIVNGLPYKVTVKDQPTAPSQTCTVTSGAGVINGVNVLNVQVSCTTNTFKVGGNVSGLVGTGLVLQNNGGNDLPIGANGVFTFVNPLASGAPFNVSIKTQPSAPAQTCSVSGGTGTVGSADISSVVVNCGSNTFTVGGNITGLVGSAVLRNNGGNDLTLSANGSFAFSLPIASGTPYAVTVFAQPSYAPRAQTCTVTSGSGTMPSANVTNVAVTCVTNTYTIGGTVSGLSSGTLVLQDNGADNKTITVNGAFTFSTPIASGNAYAVTRLSQPAGLSCNVASGAGTVTSANVTTVSVTCSPLVVLSENFDAVTAPALPAGWTSTVITGAGVQPWSTSTALADTAPNGVFVAEPTKPTDIVLDSPSFTVGSTTASLTFKHYYNLETSYDGGVLEISINGGSFTDILAAGGSFVSGGYNYTIPSAYQSTIGGRQAWSGNSGGFVAVSVQLPASAANQPAKLRWRLGTDKIGASSGWTVDTVVVTN